MARRRVAVYPEGFPKLLLQIVMEAFKAAPDIEIVSSEPVDAFIISDAAEPGNGYHMVAPLVIRIASNGREISVARNGGDPERVGDFSDAVLLSLVRGESGAKRRGFFSRLFGKHPDDSPAKPSMPEDKRRRSEVDAYFARLAGQILANIQPAPTVGPRHELAQLAEKVAGQAEARDAPPPSGLSRLTEVCGLTAAEADLLFLSSLVEVNPVAARMMGLLNDHLQRPRPCMGLMASLGHTPADLAARFDAGPLTRYALVDAEGADPLITRPIRPGADVWPLVLGLSRAEPFKTAKPETEKSLALPKDVAVDLGQVSDAIATLPVEEVLVLVSGDAGVGRTGMAARLAQRLGGAALIVPADRLIDPADINRLNRECALQDAAAIISDAHEVSDVIWRKATRWIKAPLLATSTPDGAGLLALHADRAAISCRAPRRDTAHRARMWKAVTPPDLASCAADLSERFDFSRSHIASAVSLAQSTARVQGRSAAGAADLRAASEILRNTRFEGLAERLDCPFAEDDIVLAPETRAELDLAASWARHGGQLFAPNGVGGGLHTGQGLTCLFAGPPGVGKTMAARIIAAQVDYVLYRIDLSQVVDKFIGESEKKLSALFDEAERARVALFFDEADALFGKRTEVKDSHDRYANITVDHLLQRIDEFDGLAILATNLAGNIDDAFLRRVRVRAEFQAPDAADRRRIWKKLLGDACGADIDLARLADPFELVGGEIRNAVYSAHLYAADAGRSIRMEDCVRGLWRELRKVGRVVDPALLGPWRDVVAAP